MKVLFLFFLSLNAFSSIDYIYDSQQGSCLSISTLAKELQTTEVFILGEFHNDPVIQMAQSQIIDNLKNNDSSIMWEFLNHHDQEGINNSLSLLYNHHLTVEEFIAHNAGAQNLSYRSIIKLAQSDMIPVIGLNISRSYKQKIIKDGLGSVPQSILPAQLFEGTSDYRQRFTQVMGGHVSPEMLEKYFLAQYLTDSIMAEKIIQNHQSKSFVIAGSFHTDFYDGTVFALNQLSNLNITTFKFVNSGQSTGEEIEYYKNGDTEYGLFADYIVFASE